MGKVSVCIPTYNQSAYLSAAVESAFNQTQQPIEVCIADDCSTDATGQVLTELQARYPGLLLLKQEQNLGISANVNAVLSMSRTEYIVRLDSDDLLLSNYVEVLLAMLEQYPEAGYAHAAVSEIDAAGQVLRVRRLARAPGFQSAEDALRSQASGYRVAANILMFRRQALESVNFLTTEINFAEDWDLAVRLADAGWGNVYCTQSLALYRVWSKPMAFKRKQDELNGCRHVFEKSLQPAFYRRGWDLDELGRQRRRLAKAQVLAIDSFSGHQRTALVELLKQIGDSPVLQADIALIELGFAPILKMLNRLLTGAKDLIKSALLLARR